MAEDQMGLSTRTTTLKSKCQWGFNSFMFACCLPEGLEKASDAIKKKKKKKKRLGERKRGTRPVNGLTLQTNVWKYPQS